MTIRNLKVTGAYEMSYDKHEDDRGSFQELYSARNPTYDWCGELKNNIEQINCSVSHRYVIRGIHEAPFRKLCTCLAGRIWDVVIDLREESPTYLAWEGVWLDPNNQKQIFVPARCGHGFISAENNSILMYLQDGVYKPGGQKNWKYNDPKFGIKWPLKAFDQQYSLSPADSKAECY